MKNDNLTTEPTRDLSAQLLQQAGENLRQLRVFIQQATEQSPLKLDDLQNWLGGTQPKELVRETPELKEVISSGKAAMKSFAKEQSSDFDSALQALDQIQAALESSAAQNRPNQE